MLRKIRKFQKKFFREKYLWDKKNIGVIISSGRTGTKFLADFFNDIDNVYAVHEPGPDFLQQGISYLKDEINVKELADEFKLHRSIQCRNLHKLSCTHYIESNNNLVPSLDILTSVFPNCKLALVTRDPKTYIQSAYNKYHGSGDTKYRLFGEKDKRKRVTADLLPKDAYFGQWETLSRIEKLCWFWVYSNQESMNYINKNGGKIFKFEDIFDTSGVKLYELSSYFGIDVPKKYIKIKLKIKENASHNRDLGDYSTWDKNMKSKFHQITDSTALKLGY